MNSRISLVIVLCGLLAIGYLALYFANDTGSKVDTSTRKQSIYVPGTVTTPVTTTLMDSTERMNKNDKSQKSNSSYRNDFSSATEAISDPRIPNFKRTRTPEYKDTSITYYSGDWMHRSTMTVHIDKEKYEYYHSLPRYYRPEDYHYYIEDEHSKSAVKGIVDCILKDGAKEGKTKDALAYDVIHFVQAIPYKYDIESTGQEDFPKYPLETLYDGCGDCEDMSILLAAALREMNYGVCLFVYDNHVAVGVYGGDNFRSPYFEYNGKKYYYIEATSEGRDIGDIPDEYKGKSAKIIQIT